MAANRKNHHFFLFPMSTLSELAQTVLCQKRWVRKMKFSFRGVKNEIRRAKEHCTSKPGGNSCIHSFRRSSSSHPQWGFLMWQQQKKLIWNDKQVDRRWRGEWSAETGALCRTNTMRVITAWFVGWVEWPGVGKKTARNQFTVEWNDWFLSAKRGFVRFWG